MFKLRGKPAYLLLLAAVLYLALVLVIMGVSRAALLPGVFDSNGIGISFAPDGTAYRSEAISLVETLNRQGIAAWLAAPAPFHLKIYSLPFAALSPWSGFTILSVAPLNLLYYLGILSLVYLLGREAFHRRIGLIAAALVAVWPSFLVHSTQLLKDPLFILAMLVLTLVNVKWLTQTYSWHRGALIGIVGAGAIATLRAVRSDMWEVTCAILLIGASLFIVRQVGGKRLLAGNLLGLALLIAVTVSLSQLAPRAPASLPPGAQEQATARSYLLAQADAMALRVGVLRARFIRKYPHGGLNIDTEVAFANTADMLRYLPRAAAIGFFAPFPNMWFAEGQQTGLSGRLIGGVETVIIYIIQLLAIFCLWQERRRLPVWLLALVVLVGVLALSLVVTNLGALFRMRYTFWILILILGAGGAGNISSLFARPPKLKETVPLP